jgi:small subunit ribosomal protein S2
MGGGCGLSVRVLPSPHRKKPYQRLLSLFMSTSDTHSLVERLFKAGAHFGFKKSRRHPTTLPYLFTTKEGSDIIDLEQSAIQVAAAASVLQTHGALGKTVLFVGTKEEVARLVRETAQRVGAPYVVNRWIGGILTNWSEIKKRVARMAELARETDSGELERKYTKKERVILGREADKLTLYFGGIKELVKLPDLLIVVDPRHDHIAVREARDVKVPVVGIMSSDSNVSLVTYPIVVNDALQSSVATVLSELSAAYVRGRDGTTVGRESEAVSQRN